MQTELGTKSQSLPMALIDKTEGNNTNKTHPPRPTLRDHRLDTMLPTKDLAQQSIILNEPRFCFEPGTSTWHADFAYMVETPKAFARTHFWASSLPPSKRCGIGPPSKLCPRVTTSVSSDE
eukprot:5598087-Amphidinium_carterae.1